MFRDKSRLLIPIIWVSSWLCQMSLPWIVLQRSCQFLQGTYRAVSLMFLFFFQAICILCCNMFACGQGALLVPHLGRAKKSASVCCFIRHLPNPKVLQKMETTSTSYYKTAVKISALENIQYNFQGMIHLTWCRHLYLNRSFQVPFIVSVETKTVFFQNRCLEWLEEDMLPKNLFLLTHCNVCNNYSC